MRPLGNRLLTTGASVGLVLLRIAAGGFLLPHGLGKLFGWFGGPGLDGFAGELEHFGLYPGAPLPLLLALTQTLLGLLVLAGAWTRLAALAAAAFLAATVALNLANGWFWMHGGVEYPVLWLLTHLTLAATGGGALSIDAMRSSADTVASRGHRG